jgi:hypothetical protein
MNALANRIQRERMAADGRAPTARQIRGGRLIPDFAAEQMATREFLSFPDVAKHWAPLRREGSLQAAKSAALADLLEAALDGHIPQLRFLHPGCGVEYLSGARWCSDCHCVLYRRDLNGEETDKETALLDAAKLGQMRDCSPLNDGGAYLLDQVAPYCWAPSSAVVAFLLARGVDRAALPRHWDAPAPAVPAAKGAKRGPKFKYDWQEGQQFFDRLMSERGDLDDRPDWSAQADIEREVMKHMKKHGGGEPSASLVQAHVAAWLANYRGSAR